jgi:phospholipase/carboxylesterase
MKLNFQQKNWGGLDCIIARNDACTEVKLGVVFLHGFGASGEDLVGLAEALLEQEKILTTDVAFIFPAAPIDLSSMGMPGSKAWWMIDMNRLQMAANRQDFRDLRNESPADLPACTASLRTLIEAAAREWNISTSDFCVGGFSQGSMLATDYVLHFPETKGLVIYSGTLLNASSWLPKIKEHIGCPVLQSHGTQDPILPFVLAEELHKEMSLANFKSHFIKFIGGHTIPYPVIKATSEFLVEHCLPGA